jgi:hypothetical protein
LNFGGPALILDNPALLLAERPCDNAFGHFLRDGIEAALLLELPGIRDHTGELAKLEVHSMAVDRVLLLPRLLAGLWTITRT